jgi:hypothetical protein
MTDDESNLLCGAICRRPYCGRQWKARQLSSTVCCVCRLQVFRALQWCRELAVRYYHIYFLTGLYVYVYDLRVSTCGDYKPPLIR